MGDHQAKAALYDALAESAKALANGRRAELVDVLAQGERSVEELAEEIDQTVANTSQHLQRLLRSGLVQSRREGTRIYYSLSSPVVGELWRTMRRAVSVPITDLKSRLGDIPDGAEVVAYCRGPYCIYADEAVRLLAKKGVT